MNYKKIVVSLAFLICGIGICAFFKQATLPRDGNQLIVGIAAGYAPFVSINPQGEYEGFDIDVAQALAQQMAKKLILKDLGSMTSLFVALDQGSIDVIIWGLSITSDRLKKVAMIHYQGSVTTSFPLIFWKTIPEEVRSLSDMNGKLVCVEPGSSQDFVLSSYELINKLPMDKVDDALMNIQYGKADAAFVEPAIAKKFKNKFQEIQIFDIQLAPENQVQGIGIVVRKENVELIKDMSNAVTKLKEMNVIEQLEQKWGISE